MAFEDLEMKRGEVCAGLRRSRTGIRTVQGRDPDLIDDLLALDAPFIRLLAVFDIRRLLRRRGCWVAGPEEHTRVWAQNQSRDEFYGESLNPCFQLVRGPHPEDFCVVDQSSPTQQEVRGAVLVQALELEGNKVTTYLRNLAYWVTEK